MPRVSNRHRLCLCGTLTFYITYTTGLQAPANDRVAIHAFWDLFLGSVTRAV
ncbi:uncharacterized protein EI90DRAFT_3075168 [Cantharellus anzutake]|uniref:uncharacterized protein n=1 Tax=Cantharellus anzutake TaxID=1750568 RepID=UPI001904365F|nr:uncharacterized protein EI90DRAFT_3075168 [Cantharellus anzutake]KAF8324591.1 hypothetical protein EI90DRAFT_3075168 [Cantharellus anzutake]